MKTLNPQAGTPVEKKPATRGHSKTPSNKSYGGMTTGTTKSVNYNNMDIHAIVNLISKKEVEMSVCMKEKTQAVRKKDQKEIIEKTKEMRTLFGEYTTLQNEKDKKIPIVDKLNEKAANSTFTRFYHNATKTGDLRNVKVKKLEE